MTLSDVGQSRIRGYLFILGRSLRSFLPRDVVEDAVKEVESHEPLLRLAAGPRS